MPLSSPQQSQIGFQQALRFVSWAAGIVGVLIGIAVIAGWYAHSTALVQVLPQLSPMQFNTALGFIFCGIALVSIATQRSTVARCCGWGVAILAGITLLEYLTGRDFAVDQLFFKSYARTPILFPGRMSPLTAICFLFLGSAFAVGTWPGENEKRRLLVAMMSMAVGIISAIAIAGYTLGIDSAYGWGSYARMAIHTAGTFLVLSIALVLNQFHALPRSHYVLFRWLPVSAAATLMVMIGIISIRNLNDLKTAMAWREHTYQVLLTSGALLADLSDTQRGMRGFILSGQNAALALYRQGTNGSTLDAARLGYLTRDNPNQQERVPKLSNDLQEVIGYSIDLLNGYTSNGVAAAGALESTGKGLSVVNQLRLDLDAFSAEEQRLLAQRSAAVDAGFSSNFRMLVLASLLAGSLLILATIIAGREISHRKRVEAELVANQALLRQFITHSPAAVAMLDDNMRYMETSQKWFEEHHLHDKNIIGRSHYELFPDTPADWKQDHLSALNGSTVKHREDRIVQSDGSTKWIEREVRPWFKSNNTVGGLLIFKRDITSRKMYEAEREELIGKLQKALAEIKTLSGLIPICAWCKKMRSDAGYWQSVEEYVKANSTADFTHGICPECSGKVLDEAKKVRSTD